MGSGFGLYLALLIENAKAVPHLTVKEIVIPLSKRGFPLVVIFLSLLFCQPFQIPGLSTPFGLIIAILGLQIMLGKPIWLPQKLMSKSISSKTVQKLATKTQQLMKKMGRWLHPRLPILVLVGSKPIFYGSLSFVLGLALALPLPIPLSNLAVGWSLLLTSIGLLYDDGLWVLIGYVFSLITILFFIALVLSALKYT